MIMAEMKTSSRVFELTGKRLCLDLINTLTDRATDSPEELLKSFSDFVAWGQQAHVVTDEEAQHLLDVAAVRSVEASAVLHKTIDLREVMFRIFSTLADDASPKVTDLNRFNAALSEAMSHACLVIRGDEFLWDWVNKGEALDRILWPVIRSAADILTSEEVHGVRVCKADDCNWLFLDTSKNQSRHWCDMKTCGNRAKVRRYYNRKKQQPPTSV
jgi:predicted RNA-binding Zn ribbon-like protein